MSLTPTFFDWIDQAHLLVHLDRLGEQDVALKLRRRGIRTATDLLAAFPAEEMEPMSGPAGPIKATSDSASWNGTAPLDASSGHQERHRPSRAGNRRINRTLHMMAVVQLRNQTPGRACYDTRKTGGMPSMMAMRALKRRLSNVVFARMAADQKRREEAGPGGQPGTTTDSSATDLTPDTGSSEKPHPGPATQSRTLLEAAY